MYAQQTGGLGDFFDDVNRYLDTASQVISTVKSGVTAGQKVKSGEATVQVVPTGYGIAKAVSPFTPWLIAGSVGLVAFLLLRKR